MKSKKTVYENTVNDNQYWLCIDLNWWLIYKFIHFSISIEYNGYTEEIILQKEDDGTVQNGIRHDKKGEIWVSKVQIPYKFHSFEVMKLSGDRAQHYSNTHALCMQTKIVFCVYFMWESNSHKSFHRLNWNCAVQAWKKLRHIVQ